MAKGFTFKLDGLTAIIEGFDKLEADIEQNLKREMALSAMDVVHDGRELAPWDKGDLIGGVIADDVKSDSVSVYVDIGVSAEIPYAVRMHEDEYTPGEKTATSPPNSPRVGGQKRGRKYLERALQANEKSFLERISKVFKEG